MDVEDVRRIRGAFEEVIAAIDRATPDMTHEELVWVGEQLEVVGRALTSVTTATLVERTATGHQAHERRSHRVGKDDL